MICPNLTTSAAIKSIVKLCGYGKSVLAFDVDGADEIRFYWLRLALPLEALNFNFFINGRELCSFC